MKKVLIFAIVALTFGIFAVTFFTVQYFSEQKEEQAFRSLYGAHKDFDIIYSVIQENKRLLLDDPKNDGVYDSLAQGYYVLGAVDQARDAISKATELRPDKDAYWSRLGKIYQTKKEYVGAADAYEKALKANPTKKEHYQALAWLYYFRFEGDEQKKAYVILKQGLDRFPGDTDLLFDITRYYLYEKNAEEFVTYAPQYLAVNPHDEAMQKDYAEYKKKSVKNKK